MAAAHTHLHAIENGFLWGTRQLLLERGNVGRIKRLAVIICERYVRAFRPPGGRHTTGLDGMFKSVESTNNGLADPPAQPCLD